MNGEFTYQEIMGQGESWSKSLAEAENQFKKIIAHLKKPWSEVIFTGCGSTHYLSLTAAARWQSFTQMRARGIPGSEIWLYPDTILPSKDPLLVAVSRSGSTTETIKAIHVYKERFNLDPIVISCYPDSEMMLTTNYPFLATGATEKSVAQTRSFSSMLLMTQYLMVKTASDEIKFVNQLLQLPNAFNILVKKYENIIKHLSKEQKFQKFVFLGSGINYGLACEAMLKMKEMSLSISEAFHFMEFRHGPMSMVADDTLIIGLLNDVTQKDELKVLNEMKAFGATTLVIAESAKDINADYIFELNSGIDPILRGPLYLPSLQLFAFYRAIEKGLNPDNPKNLSAFVELSD
ncbi:MAG TPA: SIS domain-containing protein [Anaerolineae bacterium]|nr:SIS domain-containing protein [Anaerolineae bacterium]